MAYTNGSHSASSLNSTFKEAYDKGFPDFHPDGVVLVNEVKFGGVEAELGGKFIVPIKTSREHGFTYAAARSGLFTLQGPKGAAYTRAEVEGSNLVGEAGIDYEAAARISKGKEAFINGTGELFKGLMEDAKFRLELSFLYGQAGLGAVQANTTAATTFRISSTTWAAGTWAGSEGARITIVSAVGGTVRGSYSIVSVNADEDDTAAVRTITIDSAATLTAGDLVFWETAVASTGAAAQECLGLYNILSSTASTLFGVTVATTPMWRANRYAVGGALTVTHIAKAAARAFVKGGLTTGADLLISPDAFQALLNPTIDPLATGNTRKVDASYSPKKVVYGTKDIEVVTQAGVIRVRPHRYVRNGDGFMLPLDQLRRVGAQDVSLTTPGKAEEGEIFIHMQNAPGYMVRCYANQAILPRNFAKCVLLTGITT